MRILLESDGHSHYRIKGVQTLAPSSYPTFQQLSFHQEISERLPSELKTQIFLLECEG